MVEYESKFSTELVNQVMTAAANTQIEQIKNGGDLFDIATQIKKRAIEMFENETYMRGLQLEQDLGI